MSDKDLTDQIPLKYGEDMYITQYDAHAVWKPTVCLRWTFGSANFNLCSENEGSRLEKYQEEIEIEDIDLEDAETLTLVCCWGDQGDFPV